MKALVLATAAATISLAACGGGGSSNDPAAPAAASSPAASTPTPASTPVLPSPNATVPTVTDTLTSGPGLSWNPATVNLTADVPGIGPEVVTLPQSSLLQNGLVVGMSPALWTGSETIVPATFRGTYDQATQNALAGMVTFVKSTDGMTWQAEALPLPAAAAGYVYNPQAMATDGNGTLAVAGYVYATPLALNADGVTPPWQSATPTYQEFVAYENLNAATPSWTVTVLPSSTNQIQTLKYAYGQWWLSYNGLANLSVPPSLQSSDLVNWTTSTAPGVNFLTGFTIGHRYWTSDLNGALNYSDDLKSWTAEGTATQYRFAPITNGSVVVSTNTYTWTSTDGWQQNSTAQSVDGVRWSVGQLGSYNALDRAFVCGSRFFAFSKSLYLSDDGLNWTNVTMPTLSTPVGSTIASFVTGGCINSLNRAFLLTNGTQIFYSN